MDLHRGAGGAEIQKGAVIAGRYRAEARVGAGGMGAVWSGEHLAVGVKVALKQLLTSAAENHEVVARFRRESVFLGKIRSDHVARVLDFVTDEKYGLILVMEFIEGDPLSKILGARTLTVEETIDLGADISAALVDLHRHHIIHRDLKPGNIIWQKLPNGTHRAVIVDFGVSRILEQGVEEDEEMTGITRADMALGTIEYMAPEQILNSRDVTPASDIYALGAILFRAHAGKHVFGDVYDAELAKKKIWTDPPSLGTGRTDKLGRGLEAVVNRALTRSPKKRYAQADEILAELNLLRDLIKAASFDMDTMTTRDNSAIIEAISAAEAKKSSQSAQTPLAPQASGPLLMTQPLKDGAVKEAVSAKDPASAPAPVSAPAQSGGSLGAHAASIPSAEPRVVKKGISPALAILGFLVFGLGGTVLGTRLGPTAGGLLGEPAAPAQGDPLPTASAATSAAPAAPASASAAPTASADATAAPSSAASAVATEASGAVSGDKPKLYGRMPDNHPSTATTPAAATTSAPTAAAAANTAAVATTPQAPSAKASATAAPKSVAPGSTATDFQR